MSYDLDLSYLDGTDYGTSFDYTGGGSSDFSGMDYLDTSSPAYEFDMQDWMNQSDPNYGQTIDLGNSDYYTDGSPVGESGWNLGGLNLNSLLNGATDLGTAYLGLRDLYETNQSNQLDQSTVRQMLKSNNQDQERAFTGQAGGFTGDAYTVGMNEQKMNLMMNLMKNNGDLPEEIRSMMEGSLQASSDPYRAQFDRLGADAINGRNAAFPDHSYLSTAPVEGQPSAVQPQADPDYSSYMAGIPEGTDPELLSAYMAYLGGAA